MKTVLTIVAFFAGLLLASESVQAQAVVEVGPISVQGLAGYKGQYLTAYYTLGNRATIATQADQIYIREVKIKSADIMITSNSVNLPPVSINRSGVFLPYNLIVFVVHSQPAFSWLNTNNTNPANEMPTPNTQYTAVASITKVDYEYLKSEQKNNSIVYNFGAKISSNGFSPIGFFLKSQAILK